MRQTPSQFVLFIFITKWSYYYISNKFQGWYRCILCILCSVYVMIIWFLGKSLHDSTFYCIFKPPLYLSVRTSTYVHNKYFLFEYKLFERTNIMWFKQWNCRPRTCTGVYLSDPLNQWFINNYYKYFKQYFNLTFIAMQN